MASVVVGDGVMDSVRRVEGQKQRVALLQFPYSLLASRNIQHWPRILIEIQRILDHSLAQRLDVLAL